jgi:hypothetical protein
MTTLELTEDLDETGLELVSYTTLADLDQRRIRPADASEQSEGLVLMVRPVPAKPR